MHESQWIGLECSGSSKKLLEPTSETLAWYRLAAKLGQPVQTLQRRTTSKEFLRWKVYMDQEPNEFNATHYYLALIALIIAKVNSNRPEKLKLDDFLLEFNVRGKSKKMDPLKITQLKDTDGPVKLSKEGELNKKMILSSLGVGAKKLPTRKPIQRLPHKTPRKKK